MKKQKIYTLTVCMLGLIALAGSTLTFAGGASSRSSIDLSNPDLKEQYLQIVLKNGKYKFVHPELKENKIPESMWKIIATELGVTPHEFYKIEKGYYTTRQIVLGSLIYKYYLDNSPTMTLENGLSTLRQAADHGSEAAISTFLGIYKHGGFGISAADIETKVIGLRLSREYINKGSEKAIRAFLSAYLHGGFGLNPDDPQTQEMGYRMTQMYADSGSEEAINILAKIGEVGGFGLAPHAPKL